MPQLKVTYFDARGRAEAIRLAFVIGGIPFDDDRFTGASFPEVKAKTPYGQVPTLTIDGEVYAQSNALLRYAGTQAGLYPSDALAALKVDEVVDTMEDLLNAAFKYRGKDKDELRTARDKFVKEDVPRFLGGVQKRLGDGVWAVGEEMTIADLVICNFVNMIRCGQLDYVPKDLAEGYERVYKIFEAVMDVKGVKEWYEKHPIKMLS